MNDFLVGIINTFQSWVGNYTVAIILFTLLVKIVLLPLDVVQRKNMQKQLALNPKVDALRAKYGKDPQKLQQKQMELYKEEKFNPFAGCLPMLIQLPIIWVVFGAIRLLANSQIIQMFDLVQATGEYIPESFLWVRNIWQPDNFSAPVIPTLQTVSAIPVNANFGMTVLNNPEVRLMSADHLREVVAKYDAVMAPIVAQHSEYVNGYALLPILSAGVSFLSQRLMPQQATQQDDKNKDNPGGMGNMMKYMNYFMPIMMAYFCWTSNAAFAIYWVMSSIIETIKQLVFRIIYPDPNKKKKDEPVVIN